MHLGVTSILVAGTNCDKSGSESDNNRAFESSASKQTNKQKDTETETYHFQDYNLSSMLHLFPVDTYWQCHCSLLFEVIGGYVL